MRTSYLPSSKHYEDYYVGQVGRGHPVFTGPRYQRGYGLGGILGGLFRSAMPLLKQGAKTLGREAIRAGVGIAQDALEGKNVKASAKNRLRHAGRNLANSAIRSVKTRITGAPKRGIKRKASGRRAISSSRNRARRSHDIFD